MAKRNQHVVSHPDGWAVRGAGGDRAGSVHRTQEAAIHRGRETARQQGTELLIHGQNGRIRERDSHGKDRCLPRG